MADHLARIFGTEEDRINCPFFYKIGACRHGERCSRTHVRPQFSTTVLVPHFYTPPPAQPDANGVMQPVDDAEVFEDFYEEIMEELIKFGEIEQLICLENLGDHMFGNVYVKYAKEEEAEKCVLGLRGRYYAGRLVLAEYSPVTSFGEARCRQFDEGHCARGGYCNFMHLRHVPRFLKKELHHLSKKARDAGRRRSRSRSRSRERDRGSDRKSSSSRRSPSPKKKLGGSEMTDEEARRAKIAAWNAKKEAGATAASGTTAAAPAGSAAGGHSSSSSSAKDEKSNH